MDINPPSAGCLENRIPARIFPAVVRLEPAHGAGRGAHDHTVRGGPAPPEADLPQQPPRRRTLPRPFSPASIRRPPSPTPTLTAVTSSSAPTRPPSSRPPKSLPPTSAAITPLTSSAYPSPCYAPMTSSPAVTAVEPCTARPPGRPATHGSALVARQRPASSVDGERRASGWPAAARAIERQRAR